MKESDFLVVRELTGGVFRTTKERRTRADGGITAVDTLRPPRLRSRTYSEKLAFELAASRRNTVTSVDQSPCWETSRLWREHATALAKNFPKATLQHVLVDTAAMRLVMSPSQFDVLVTENTFGDILTDEAAVLVGFLWRLPLGFCW